MLRETKFGYGFLLAGAGLPYLIDKVLGPVSALVALSACLLIGIGFLFAGHFHRDIKDIKPRRGIMATIGMFTLIGATSGALIGSISGAIWGIAHKKEENPSPTAPVQIATSKLSTQYEIGPGPIPPPSDSVSTVVTPSDPKYGAMTGGFSTSGNGEYEVDILKVAPEKLEFDPPGISIKREQLPVDLKIDEHRTVTVKSFTNRGFVIDDHRWPGVAMNVTLLHTLPSPEEKKMNPESDKVAPSSKIIQKGKNNIAQIGNNNQATIIEKEHLVLSDEDGDVITEQLKGFAGHGIKIFLNRETQETNIFGNALAGRLRKAGINVPEITHMQVLGAMPPGISFIVSKKNPDTEFLNRLTEILTEKKLAQNPIQASWSENIDISILYVTPLD